MKIDLSAPEPVIEASDLAQHLRLEPQDVMDLMRAGTITSRFETGVGEHANTYRLSFTHDGTRVRFTCDAQGNVFKTARFPVGKQK